jgi:hypothetical protein
LTTIGKFVPPHIRRNEAELGAFAGAASAALVGIRKAAAATNDVSNRSFIVVLLHVLVLHLSSLKGWQSFV